jgi:hypothetical protein
MPRYFSPTVRRRLAPVSLVAGLLLLGKVAYEDVPREQDVRFVLTPAQQRELGAIRVIYSEEGEALGGMERHFSTANAPAELTHAPSLRSGHYDVSVELTARDGRVTHLRRAFDLPSEGAPRILLGGGP